jgi:hypothetical protein
MENSETSPVSLETVLVAATFDPSCRPFFYRNLVDAEVYAGIVAPPTSPGRSPQFAAVDREGQDFVAVFTSESMVPPQFAPLKMKFGDFVTLSGTQRISLNPGQAVTKDFSPQELRSIAGGELGSPTAFQKNAPGKFALKSPTAAMTHRAPLAMLLKDHPRVKCGWLADAEALSDSRDHERRLGVWLGLDVAKNSDWEDVASDCTILLSTLDHPPGWFKVERCSTPPPTAQLFYKCSNSKKTE